MPDYKKMYLTMFRASEEAINILIAAQQQCEELYLASPEPELIALDLKSQKENQSRSPCPSQGQPSHLEEGGTGEVRDG